MDGSEHELPLRDPRSVAHEVDYWQAVNEELRAVVDVGPRIAAPLVEIPVAMLELVLGGDREAAIEKVGASVKQALGEVEQLGEKVDVLSELVAGRLISLRREAGLEA